MGRGRSKVKKIVDRGKSRISSSDLKPGESAFASFPPTSLHPDGEPVIAKTADGGYRYLGYIPKEDDVTVDKSSQDYKQAKRDFNVKLAIAKDGTVQVSEGGLYSRQRTFNSLSAFRADALKRLDRSSQHDKDQMESLQSGRISQIQAEYFRGIVRKKSSAAALKDMKNAMAENVKAVKARLEVAENAKTKLKMLKYK